MKKDYLNPEEVRIAYGRFCELYGGYRYEDKANAAFWTFLGNGDNTHAFASSRDWKVGDVNDHVWGAPQGATERLNMLLSPHAEALWKAYNIRQGK